jgi:glucokinase
MSIAEYAIGVDLGGTNMRAGLVDRLGSVLSRRSEPLGRDKSPAAVIGQMREMLKELVAKAPRPPAVVGCGIPGIVDYERGILHRSPNLPQWRDVAIRDEIADALGMPVVVDNDANQHALGEHRLGAGRGHHHMVLLTLGTGIGGGLIFDGKIFHGDCGFAGEVGHIVIEPDGIPCGCGKSGCWEQYAASHSFAVHAARLKKAERESLLSAAAVSVEDLTPELVGRLANEGHPVARGLWNTYGLYLGMGIATLINTLGVTTFVIGGGIARSWDRFIGAAKNEIANHTYEQNVERLHLLPAALGDDAGVIGAALEGLALPDLRS